MAIAVAGGRADRDEHRLRLGNGGGKVGGEEQAAVADVAGDQLLQPRLEDRHDALLQPRDLGRVLVDAGDDMAEVRKAGTRDQADIACPDHGNPHAFSPAARPPLQNGNGAGMQARRRRLTAAAAAPSHYAEGDHRRG